MNRYRFVNYDLVAPFRCFQSMQRQDRILEREALTESKWDTKAQNEWSQYVEMALRLRHASVRASLKCKNRNLRSEQVIRIRAFAKSQSETV